MKIKLSKILIGFLLVLSFFYSDITLDRSNPLNVIERNFAYLKNSEWFLTFNLYKPEDFSYSVYDNYFKYNLSSLIKYKPLQLKINSEKAKVSGIIFFKDKQNLNVDVFLEKIDNSWYINSVNYGER